MFFHINEKQSSNHIMSLSFNFSPSTKFLFYNELLLSLFFLFLFLFFFLWYRCEPHKHDLVAKCKVSKVLALVAKFKSWQTAGGLWKFFDSTLPNCESCRLECGTSGVSRLAFTKLGVQWIEYGAFRVSRLVFVELGVRRIE